MGMEQEVADPGTAKAEGGWTGLNPAAGREEVGSCTPPDAFLHLVGAASIDGTPELLLPPIANTLGMVER